MIEIHDTKGFYKKTNIDDINDFIEMSYGEPWSKTRLYSTPYFHFESPNNRSEPLDVISILKCAWRLNFTFFEIFLLFINPL